MGALCDRLKRDFPTKICDYSDNHPYWNDEKYNVAKKYLDLILPGFWAVDVDAQVNRDGDIIMRPNLVFMSHDEIVSNDRGKISSSRFRVIRGIAPNEET